MKKMYRIRNFVIKLVFWSKVPKIDCLDSNEIPYTDCEGTEKEQMTTSMSCEVKHTTSCEPAVRFGIKSFEKRFY